MDEAFEQDGKMRVVFVIIFNANPPQQKDRVKRVCEGFMGTIREVPHLDAIPEMIREHEEEIKTTTKMI